MAVGWKGRKDMSTIVKLKSSMLTSIRSYDWSRLQWKNLDRMKLYYMFRTMLHPISSFEEIRYNKRGSVLIATVLFGLNFLVQIMSFSGLGFIFNMNRPETFNIWLEFLKSDLIIVLWCVANWATTTLLEGEGKFSQIWVVTNYIMLPKILFTPFIIAFSNIICTDEVMFYNFFNFLLYAWVLVLGIIGFTIIHQFKLIKTFLSSIFTGITIAFILFVSLLFISIAQQVTMFLKTIISEIILRL